MDDDRYLMAISIGPVQGFIAAARRTRDFWMGSAILSEVAKAVALRIVEEVKVTGGGDPSKTLIFPAPRNLEDLEPWDLSDRPRASKSNQSQ